MSQREVPLGINTALGAVAVVVCCVVPATPEGHGVDARLAVLAVGVAAFAAAVVDPLAVVVTAGVAFLLFDGFVEGRQGALVWSGHGDLLRLASLYVAGALGLILGAVHRWRQRQREVGLAGRTTTSLRSVTLPPAVSPLHRVPQQREINEPVRDEK